MGVLSVRKNVTVDSADELFEHPVKDFTADSDDFFEDNGKLLSKSFRQLSTDSAGCDEDGFLSLPITGRKRHHHKAPVRRTKPAGIRWVLGSNVKVQSHVPETCSNEQDSYMADLDDSETETEVLSPPVDLRRRESSSLQVNEPASLGLMFQNPVFDFDADAFGTAIGDGYHKCDGWGQYDYIITSNIGTSSASGMPSSRLLD